MEDPEQGSPGESRKLADIRAKARAKVAAQAATTPAPTKVEQKNFSCLYCQGAVDAARNFIHERHCTLARKRDKKGPQSTGGSTADDDCENIEDELREFAKKLEQISK